jgi:hypothetical protein
MKKLPKSSLKQKAKFVFFRKKAKKQAAISPESEKKFNLVATSVF